MVWLFFSTGCAAFGQWTDSLPVPHMLQDSLPAPHMLQDSLPPLIMDIPLGDTAITFHWHYPERQKLLFLVIHDDENTSTDVAYKALSGYDASLLELKNDGKYTFTWFRDTIPYTFNPNRIFSLNGIESTMLQFGACDSAAVTEINLFALQVAGAFFLQPAFIVALHNNKDQGFSIQSYNEDTLMIPVADSVFINPDKDLDNFYYVNDPDHFTFIKNKGYNVILQTAGILEDDGSLSIWCSRKGIPYINIEAEHGHHEEQMKMLYDISDLFLY